MRRTISTCSRPSAGQATIGASGCSATSICWSSTCGYSAGGFRWADSSASAIFRGTCSCAQPWSANYGRHTRISLPCFTGQCRTSTKCSNSESGEGTQSRSKRIWICHSSCFNSYDIHRHSYRIVQTDWLCFGTSGGFAPCCTGATTCSADEPVGIPGTSNISTLHCEGCEGC